MKAGACLDVVAAAYRLDVPPKRWLEGIVTAARPELDQGHGLWAIEYDISTSYTLKLGATAATGLFPGWDVLLKFGLSRVPADDIRRTFRGAVCATVGEVMGRPYLDAHPIVRPLASLGIHDALGINATDPTGHGYLIAVPLASPGPTPERTRERWSAVAAHVATASRVRRGLRAWAQGSGRSKNRRATIFDGAEAILERDGRCQHAEGPAAPAYARELLREAAELIDSARGPRGREDPDGALAHWTALVAGRWSLMDCFDSDGRRYFVARSSEVSVPATHELTPRQRQTLAYACLGHSNKLIAYELGLSEQTVSNHLRRAARRHGVGSRAELIRVGLRSLMQPVQ